MYRDSHIREYVNQIISEQQHLIRSWSLPSFDRDGSYAGRLRGILNAAMELESYRKILGSGGVAAVQRLLEREAGYREMLETLPILSKAEYRAICEEACQARRKDMLNYFETSGTTGTPLPAPKSLRDFTINTVNFGEHWANFLSEDDVALILINTPQGPAAFQFEHALNYSGIATFRTWVDTIRNDYDRVIRIADFLRPTVFAGPPCQLINLYEYANANRIAEPSFKKVLLTGERSSPSLKQRLRRLTGGEVFDASYGSSETGTTAVAVSDSILKLQTHSYIFEIIDQHNRMTLVTSDSSAKGELVVTSLENTFRPLIRYRTGDLVQIECRGEGFQSVTPLGRVGTSLEFMGLDMYQDEFERLVWPEDGQSRIYNYFIACHEDRVYFVFTGDYENEEQAERHLGLLKETIRGVVVCLVPKLPEITGLVSTLGWKASRVHDLRRPAAPSHPAQIRKAIEELRSFIETLRDKAAVG